MSSSRYESGSRWCGWIRTGPRHWRKVFTAATEEEVSHHLERFHSTQYFDVGNSKPLASKRHETIALREGLKPIRSSRRGGA